MFRFTFSPSSCGPTPCLGKIQFCPPHVFANTYLSYALKFTLPQIIRNMGFTSTTAQLLTAP
jgi:hypothetical protein